MTFLPSTPLSQLLVKGSIVAPCAVITTCATVLFFNHTNSDSHSINHFRSRFRRLTMAVWFTVKPKFTSHLERGKFPKTQLVSRPV